MTRLTTTIAPLVMSLVYSNTSMATVDWVGNMNPPGSSSSPLAIGDAGPFVVTAEVFEPGVTAAAGQGAGIACFLQFGAPGQSPSDLAMVYDGDAGNNDRYRASLATAALPAGNASFTAWCSDDGGATRTYRDASDGGDGIIAITPVPAPAPGNAVVQLFEWQYTDVGQECAYLATTGYTAVQVSSPAEHLSPAIVGGNPWWVRYQPVSYQLESRSGTAADFAAMVAACDAAGIDVYVDAILNHMSNAGSGALGTAGTFYFGNSYDYPGTHAPADFHYCGTNPGSSQLHDLNDFSDRFQTQFCELSGLADIDTAAATPRGRLVDYLQILVDLGVDGFRLDAAKHVPSSDLQAILGALGGAPYVVQEVIDSPNEDVRFYEYLVNGDVTEFDFGYTVGAAFNGCGSNIASLAGLGPGLFAGDDALVFVDNHDTQRSGGCVLTHQSGARYDLANVFMLAYPYGYPRVMSSYYFGSFNQGPPADSLVTRDVWIDGEPAGCNEVDWVCEHRRPAMANLARLRQLADGEPVTDWWDDGSDRIAFGRGDKGFVAINNSASAVTRTWSTTMAAGTYCNIARYDIVGDPATCRYPGGLYPAPTAELVDVEASGQIVAYTIDGLAALAIHAQAQVVVADLDTDGVPDDLDNCSEAENPDQRDTDADGFGNRCDADLNNDGIVNFGDLAQLKAAWLSSPNDAHWNPNADLNGDDLVNFGDLVMMKATFLEAPGPGAVLPPVEPTCGIGVTGLDPAAAFGDVMFLRGTLSGGWAAIPGQNDFSNLGNDTYGLELELAAGDYAYKVANDGWTIERTNIVETLTDGGSVVLEDNGGGSPNADVLVPASGCYTFTLDAVDTDFPVLFMDRKF